MAVATRRRRWSGLLCLPFWAEAAGPGPSLLPDPELAKALAQLAGPSVRFGETLLLGLSINGVPQPQTLRAVRVREGLAVPQQLWNELHLKLPALAPRLIDGEVYIVLGSFGGSDGASWQIDEATQTLVIEAPASAFKGQTLGLERQAPRVTLPPQLGFFANYDVQWQRRLGAPGRGGSSSLDALLELGALSGLGDLNSQHLYRQDGRLLRLDTRWTLDQPERMTRLRIGDSISQPGTWGRAMRFGGLQWGTDFSLRPGFLSFPLPTLRGEAALPSTVDVYVNNSQRLQGRLQPGAFDISDLPIVTGQGEIRTVVRDLLGREQVVVQPYYVSPALLKPGLHAWSMELGQLREDYGLASDRYGSALLSLSNRRGISEQFTGELRAELLARQQTAGAAGIWLWPALGTGSLALALSRSREQGRGWLLSSGLDRQGRDWSGSIELRRASAGFAQLGQPALQTGDPARQARWSVAGAIGSNWGATTLGLSYLQQGGGGIFEARPRLLSLNLGRSLGDWGYLSLFGLRDLAPGGGNSLALNWSFALGERSGGSVGLVRNHGAGQPERPQLQAQFQQNPPMGEGLGYQLLAETGKPGRAVAQAYWQGNKATLNAGAASNGRYKDLRAGASGGLAWLDGAAYLSRRIDGGFAVVQVGDYADVGVWHDNQPVARTDASGRAFIGSLRGYQSNRVGINAADLPFDAELEALEVKLTPAARSAALISFPVLRSRAASFRLLDARGQPIPPGSELLVPGPDPVRPRSFAVGLEGRAFASGLAEGSQLLQVRWPDGGCSVKLVLPPAPADLPELGPLTCR